MHGREARSLPCGVPERWAFPPCWSEARRRCSNNADCSARSTRRLDWPETASAAAERELREYEIADGVCVPNRFVYRSFLAREFPEAKPLRSNVA